MDVYRGRGSEHSVPIATESLLARRRDIGAPKNTSAAVGDEVSRSLIGCLKATTKRLPDRLPMGARGTRSPSRKSAGAARRPSHDACFSEARAARKRSRIPGEKSSSI